MNIRSIEINPQFKKALNWMENTNKAVFVTGRAGTGKSTLLEYFKKTTSKNIVVLAPTGVAAVNIKGQTIHSFFHFKPDITLTKVSSIVKKARNLKLYKNLQTIVIDEISMVRADLLDCIDKFLKLARDNSQPFGNVQMVFIGDLYQLSPVLPGRDKKALLKLYDSPYFFDSNVFKNFHIELIELDKIYRQKDKHFIELLNRVRNNTVTDRDMATINSRLDKSLDRKANDLYVFLTTTNAIAADLNNKQLSKLASKLRIYKGGVSGEFGKQSLPTDINLSLKKGSQVMLLNNDSAGRWINGSIGKILTITTSKETEYDIISVKLLNGRKVEVSPFEWELFRFTFDHETHRLVTKSVGSFIQYPIKLAWALTIHKSQGKTFKKVVIDIGTGTFTFGQIYVALSRCTSLDGIVLKTRIAKKNIWVDWRVKKFLTDFQYKLSDKRLSLSKKVKIIELAIQKEKKLEIVYLRAQDEKSDRIIKPYKIGVMKYLGKKFTGIEAYCYLRKTDRVFRVDRILELKSIS